MRYLEVISGAIKGPLFHSLNGIDNEREYRRCLVDVELSGFLALPRPFGLAVFLHSLPLDHINTCRQLSKPLYLSTSVSFFDHDPFQTVHRSARRFGEANRGRDLDHGQRRIAD